MYPMLVFLSSVPKCSQSREKQKAKQCFSVNQFGTMTSVFMIIASKTRQYCLREDLRSHAKFAKYDCNLPF